MDDSPEFFNAAGQPGGRAPRLRVPRGQGLVELALAIPVLMLLAIGTLDLGMAFYVKVVLENSAREGAYAMIYPAEDTTDRAGDARKAAENEAKDYRVHIDDADVAITCVPDTACPAGSTVVVTVTHQMDLLVDVLFKGPLTLTGEARMFVP